MQETSNAPWRMAIRTTQNMTPSTTTHYVYDRAGRLLAECTGTGTAPREYIWIDDLPLALVAEIDTASPKLWYVSRETDGAIGLVGRSTDVINPTARKVSWQEVGHVAEPGRYLFKFGWLTITAADLAIWQSHPNAAFTLVRVPETSSETSEDIAEEYHLGAIELRD